MNSKKAVKSLSALPGAFMIPKQASITMIESSAAEAVLENPFWSFEINLPISETSRYHLILPMVLIGSDRSRENAVRICHIRL
jgi:hypothetical protein